MKIGFEMMLWTTQVTDAHRPILEDIKKTGYDGVEIPIFEGTPDDYARLGRMLDDIGLERTAISVIGRLDQNPLSADPAHRRAGVEHMISALDCCQAMGVSTLGGPLHSTYGHFSGNPPTADEKARARDFHREVGDIAARAQHPHRDRGAQSLRMLLRQHHGRPRRPCRCGRPPQHQGGVRHLPRQPRGSRPDRRLHAQRRARHPRAHLGERSRRSRRGHVPWAATFSALRKSGYDGWLTIESFGRALPALAAATKIWRDLSETPGGCLSRRFPPYPRRLGGGQTEDQGGVAQAQGCRSRHPDRASRIARLGAELCSVFEGAGTRPRDSSPARAGEGDRVAGEGALSLVGKARLYSDARMRARVAMNGWPRAPGHLR